MSHVGKAVSREALPPNIIDQCEARSRTIREIIYQHYIAMHPLHVESDRQGFCHQS